MRLAILPALLVAAALTLAPTAGAATSTVIAGDAFFWSNATSSSVVTVKVGDTVSWENHGDLFHNVVADDGASFKSATLAPRGAFSHTFSRAGTYAYVCTLHRNEKMVGKIIVQAASVATPASSLFLPYSPR